MRRKFFIPFLLINFFIIDPSFCQQTYTEGYVLLETGDTLRGKIKDNVETDGDPSLQKIRFVDANGQKQKIDAKQAKEYRKNGFPPYRRILTNRGNKKFARVVEEGDIILYKYFREKGGGGSGFASVGSATFGSRDVVSAGRRPSTDVEYYIQWKGDKEPLLMVPNSGFKRIMSKFFERVPDIKIRIENEMVVRMNLEETVHEYNTRNASK